MKKSLKEQVAPPAPAAGAAPVRNATGNLSASAKKLQDRLAKVPGLDKLMSTVTKRDDAAEILAAIAEKLGGDKIAGSKALTAALNIAKEEEKLNEHAEKRVQAFVRYLFE